MSIFLILGLLVMGVHRIEACTYNGREYRVGSIWKADDNCNDCTCSSYGTTCTRLPNCGPYPSPTRRPTRTRKPRATVPPGYHEYCTYDGVYHRTGDIWTALDGCNQCTCGIVAATCTTNMKC